MDLGITTKEFMEEYCILLGNSMYGYVDAAILWIRLLAKYLVNECNIEKRKEDTCIFFGKYKKGKLELVMSVHVDKVFMAGKPETLKGTKENIKEKFNISESGRVNNFIGVYCKWVHYAKGTYVKTTTEKDVNNILEGKEKYTDSDLNI